MTSRTRNTRERKGHFIIWNVTPCNLVPSKERASIFMTESDPSSYNLFCLLYPEDGGSAFLRSATSRSAVRTLDRT
jgi:hypothetical protein